MKRGCRSYYCCCENCERVVLKSCMSVADALPPFQQLITTRPLSPEAFTEQHE